MLGEYIIKLFLLIYCLLYVIAIYSSKKCSLQTSQEMRNAQLFLLVTLLPPQLRERQQAVPLQGPRGPPLVITEFNKLLVGLI